MAVGGTVSTPVFVKDGQYISLLADAAITIGNVVEYTATGTDTCTVGTVADSATSYAGVAVGGDRYSRTQTDNVIAAASKVTVCTRGIVRVYTDTSAILRGSFVEAGATGVVGLLGTNGTAHYPEDILGIALDANSSAATTIRIKLVGR